MNHPKVYDAKGRVLEKGSRVITAGFGAMPPGSPVDAGTVHLFTKEFVGAFYRPAGVEVEWPDYDTTTFDWYPLSEDDRCPDLLLITDDEKGDGDG